MYELRQEGREIAQKLGNGVTYLGPQMNKNNEFIFHLFNDDPALTGTTFVGKTFEGAKKNLINKRKLFNSFPPTF
ncbi:MAG: hypothetical protein ABIB55_01490 [Candidatus Nealsonbacteria bacterium]